MRPLEKDASNAKTHAMKTASLKIGLLLAIIASASLTCTAFGADPAASKEKPKDAIKAPDLAHDMNTVFRDQCKPLVGTYAITAANSFEIHPGLMLTIGKKADGTMKVFLPEKSLKEVTTVKATWVDQRGLLIQPFNKEGMNIEALNYYGLEFSGLVSGQSQISMFGSGPDSQKLVEKALDTAKPLN